MDTIISLLNTYSPFNEQESEDLKIILSYVRKSRECLFRSSPAHITVSAVVINPEHTKLLMAYHNIYQSWAWLCGHADGNDNLIEVAMKEAQEESGLDQVTPVSNEIFSIELLPVSGHIKNGKYVSSHLHLNITFQFEANEQAELSHNPDENSAVKWIPLEQVSAATSEPWMDQWIYRKLIQKIRACKSRI